MRSGMAYRIMRTGFSVNRSVGAPVSEYNAYLTSSTGYVASVGPSAPVGVHRSSLVAQLEIAHRFLQRVGLFRRPHFAATPVILFGELTHRRYELVKLLFE